jgi:O-Antigen ligase
MKFGQSARVKYTNCSPWGISYPSSLGTYFTFYFVILTCLQAPMIYNRMLNNPVPGTRFFVVLMVIGILFINLWKRFGAGHVRLPWDQSDLIALLLIWVLLCVEIFHVALNGADISLEFIVQYVWLYLLYYTIRSFRSRLNVQRTAFTAVNQLISLMSLIQLAAYAGIINLGLSDFIWFKERPDVFNMNSGSYFAAFASLLYLFFMPRGFSMRKKCIYGVLLIPSVVLIFVNQTRGAALLLLMIIFLKMIFSKHRVWRYLLLVSMFAAVLGIGLRGSELITKMEYYLSMGRGLTSKAENIATGSPENGATNIYVRTQQFPVALEEFENNPILGKGHKKACTFKVAGFGFHTHYLTMIVAYGLAGTIPMILLIFSLLRPSAKTRIAKQIVAACLFVVTSLTFEDNLYYWYAILACLVRFPGEDVAVSEVTAGNWALKA